MCCIRILHATEIPINAPAEDDSIKSSWCHFEVDHHGYLETPVKRSADGEQIQMDAHCVRFRKGPVQHVHLGTDFVFIRSLSTIASFCKYGLALKLS
jgi:hypothetical protein